MFSLAFFFPGCYCLNFSLVFTFVLNRVRCGGWVLLLPSLSGFSMFGYESKLAFLFLAYREVRYDTSILVLISVWLKFYFFNFNYLFIFLQFRFIVLILSNYHSWCSNSTRGCQAKLVQNWEARHGLLPMRKTLVSVLKQSSKQLSRKGTQWFWWLILLRWGCFQKSLFLLCQNTCFSLTSAHWLTYYSL